MIISISADNEQDANVLHVIDLARALGVNPVSEVQQGGSGNIVLVMLKDAGVKAKSLRESIFSGLPGVISVARVSLAKVDVFAGRQQPHSIWLGPTVTIGASKPCVLILGPCTTDPTISRSIAALDELGVKAVRSGPFKPRSSSGSFRGNGERAVRWYLTAVQAARNVEVAFMEVMEACHIALVAKIVDEIAFTKTIVLWVGAHTENVELLVELGRQTQFPVMLKNGKRDQSVDALRGRADWILETAPHFDEFGRPIPGNRSQAPSVNESLMFCLRGTFAEQPSLWRNDPNYHWVDTLRSRGAWAPIIIDPSHVAGDLRYLTTSIDMALLARPDGLIVETGYPREGWHGLQDVPEGYRGACDVGQSLPLEDVPELLEKIVRHNALYHEVA